MHFTHILFWGVSAHTWLAAGQPLNKSDAAATMHKLRDEYYETTRALLPHGACTKDNIAVRREWDSLSKIERLDYLRATQCLQSKPSKGNGNTLTQSRFEDFVLGHINATLNIHISGLLLPWHRYFVNLYEKALREECGYKGYQPYWDWSKYAVNPEGSSIFDGSKFSFGSNGEAVPHGIRSIPVSGGPPPAQYLTREPGTGGGCVLDGPFANQTLILDATNDGASSPIRIWNNPRCLTRDFLLSYLTQQNSYENVTDLILNSPDIHTFRPGVEAALGIHGGGHVYISGENLNFFTSPHDPAFYLHHAMLDRVWAIWQSRDLATRKDALDGTLTWGDYPPHQMPP
ncbi:Tyrosinase-like protein orsC [Cladobotryum mycophilum]|uniref:Tyrosinase-like protein orsC n=1 Tax=Cladobotryum mycophilum TaxID=491253 RepID=A0ABR0SBR0_9HYPO